MATKIPYTVKGGRLINEVTGEVIGTVESPYDFQVSGDAVTRHEPGDEGEEEQSEETTALTVIDPAQPENLVPSLSNLPMHFRAMGLHLLPAEEQAEKIYQSTEYLGVPAVKLSRYANSDITVVGAAIIFHPPYMKNDKLNSTLQPGYYKAYMRLDTGTVVSTSAWRVSQMLAALLPVNGWFDWAQPVTFHVEVDDKNAQYLRRVKK